MPVYGAEKRWAAKQVIRQQTLTITAAPQVASASVAMARTARCSGGRPVRRYLVRLALMLKARDHEIATLREENERIKAVLAEWQTEHAERIDSEQDRLAVEAADLPPHASNAGGPYPAVFVYPAADQIWRNPDTER